MCGHGERRAATESACPGFGAFAAHRGHARASGSSWRLRRTPAQVESSLGQLCLHSIKETWTLREEGGVTNFCHSFIAEAQALARAHVAARGGNAALMYRLTQVKLIDNTYKNHLYILVSLQADCVCTRSR